MRKSKLELENYGSVVSLKLEIILDVKCRCCILMFRTEVLIYELPLEQN